MTLKILIIGILVYFIWALVHHKRNKSLTFPILVEYLLIALLSVVILMGVIF